MQIQISPPQITFSDRGSDSSGSPARWDPRGTASEDASPEQNIAARHDRDDTLFAAAEAAASDPAGRHTQSLVAEAQPEASNIGPAVQKSAAEEALGSQLGLTLACLETLREVAQEAAVDRRAVAMVLGSQNRLEQWAAHIDEKVVEELRTPVVEGPPDSYTVVLVLPTAADHSGWTWYTAFAVDSVKGAALLLA